MAKVLSTITAMPAVVGRRATAAMSTHLDRRGWSGSPGRPARAARAGQLAQLARGRRRARCGCPCPARQDLAHEPRGAAVERRAGQHLVARLEQGEDAGGGGGHAGGEDERRLRPPPARPAPPPARAGSGSRSACRGTSSSSPSRYRRISAAESKTNVEDCTMGVVSGPGARPAVAVDGARADAARPAPCRSQLDRLRARLARRARLRLRRPRPPPAPRTGGRRRGSPARARSSGVSSTSVAGSSRAVQLQRAQHAALRADHVERERRGRRGRWRGPASRARRRPCGGRASRPCG